VPVRVAEHDHLAQRERLDELRGAFGT
jgi:hypothetical protein